MLKVCDDKFCIEIFNVSNLNTSQNNNCGYTIYASTKSLPIDIDIWIIVVLSILVFLLLLLCIIYMSCHLCKQNNTYAHASQHHGSATNGSTNRSSNIKDITNSPNGEYVPIPGEIRTDSPAYFMFKRKPEEDEDNDDDEAPVPTVKNGISEEELLIDKAFPALKTRKSNTLPVIQDVNINITDDNNTIATPHIAQMQHRSSVVCIDIEHSEESDYKQTNNEYDLLPMSRTTTQRSDKSRTYPAEYELNHLESMRENEFSVKNRIDGSGTQDDMIYQRTDNVDHVSIDHFDRLSTIRLIKFFAPQEIKYSDIDFKQQQSIGKGSVGEVFKAKYNGIHVAVKKLNDKYLNLSAKDLQNFKREASIMQKVGGHKHIARMYGFCTHPEICIVTEYYSRGSLHDIIKYNRQNKNKNKKKKLNNSLKIQMCIDASLGILHLHQQNVIHRDISARNLLVDKNWTVVVADLGMSRLKKKPKNDNSQHFGPIKWMAPESIIKHEYSEKTDAYSFGITLYEIFSELDVYPSLLPLEAGAKVVTEGLRPKIKHLQFAKDIPDLARLMRKLWRYEPTERLKFVKICERLKKIKNK